MRGVTNRKFLQRFSADEVKSRGPDFRYKLNRMVDYLVTQNSATATNKITINLSGGRKLIIGTQAGGDIIIYDSDGNVEQVVA